MNPGQPLSSSDSLTVIWAPGALENRYHALRQWPVPMCTQSTKCILWRTALTSGFWAVALILARRASSHADKRVRRILLRATQRSTIAQDASVLGWMSVAATMRGFHPRLADGGDIVRVRRGLTVAGVLGIWRPNRKALRRLNRPQPAACSAQSKLNARARREPASRWAASIYLPPADGPRLARI